ncbi:hypothetical protein VT84_20840 [Gemmata sp. SH-PL17]|uniref:DUF1559 family PulG-like putative transporter n=1 Tax=Gemmata sp. SH-PL17 TaxID=1630693 RepID=UPI00078D3D09|nr:DUF1559 domain-containing protein [Gemmata sp. SH-PL17]AMV26860.1 hypothetical protein VT84_20840 [Gemmata sp. SH-PL17]
MIQARLLPGLALIAGLSLYAPSTAQQPPLPGSGPGEASPAASALPVVPKSAGAFVTLKVSDLARNPDLKAVLAQLAKQPDALAGLTEVIGVSPMEIDRVTLFWPRLVPHGGAEPILVVTTTAPFNEVRVLKNLKAEPVFESHLLPGQRAFGGAPPRIEAKSPTPVERPVEVVPDPKDADSCSATADGGDAEPLCYSLARNPFSVLFLVDDRTLVFLPGERNGELTRLALLSASLKKNATGPLADALAAAGNHTFAAGVHLSPLFREFDRHVPRDLVPYTALLAARNAVITGDLNESAKLKLTLTFDDATAAKRAAPVLEEGIGTVAEKLNEWAAEMKESRRPFEKSAAPIMSTFAASLKKVSVKTEGAAVLASTEVDAGPVASKAFGDLLQAVQSRKKAEQRMNNLKMIGIALHSYHDANGRFPTNVYGPKGEVLLSWRVHLLPYLEQDNLYRQFKMDEAWDGPNNKALIEKMPKVYLAPDRDHAKGETFYQGFIGSDPQKGQPKGIFGRPWLRQGEKTGLAITSIHDGTSNTLAVIEAGEGVIWSKPADLPFGGAVPPLGDKGWDRTPALRFDGSVSLFPTNLKPELFWPYVTIDGGEVTVDPEDAAGSNRPPLGARTAPPPAVKVAPK